MKRAGRIIVLVNMALSFIFLGMTALIFTTKVDLRAEEQRQNAILKPIKDAESSIQAQTKGVEEQATITDDRIKDLKSKAEKSRQDAESNYQGLLRELGQVRTEIAELQTKVSDSQRALTQNREEVRKQEQNQAELLAKMEAESRKKFDLENRLFQKTNTLAVLKDRAAELSQRVKELQSPRSSTGNRGN